MRAEPPADRPLTRAASGAVYAPPIERSPDHDALVAANDRFYLAFEAGDMDAMSELWDHGDEVACTHPGWSTLHGWAAVAASWFAMFQSASPMQFILTEQRSVVAGTVGWVFVDENVIAQEGGGTVAALNLFVLGDDGWRMVAHHGSSVAPHRG